MVVKFMCLMCDVLSYVSALCVLYYDMCVISVQHIYYFCALFGYQCHRYVCVVCVLSSLLRECCVSYCHMYVCYVYYVMVSGCHG